MIDNGKFETVRGGVTRRRWKKQLAQAYLKDSRALLTLYAVFRSTKALNFHR